MAANNICNRNNVEIWRSRLFRKFTTVAAGSCTTNFTGLQALSDAVASEAEELISVSALNIEGGSGAGIQTGNKMEILQALEEILATDPTSPNNPLNNPQPPRVWAPDYRFCQP